MTRPQPIMSPLFNTPAPHLVDIEFSEQLPLLLEECELPVLVCFAAPRSAGVTRPGRLLRPELAKLVARRGHELRVATVDIDQHPELVQQHHVHQLPAVCLWYEGREIARIHGAPVAEVLDRFVSSALDLDAERRASSEALEQVAQ